MSAQERGIGPLAALRHYIAHQPLVAPAILPADHRGLRYRSMAGQDRLNLAGLNAEAPDLELLVSAAQERRAALGAPPGQVPGAVHPRAGRSIRIGHKAFGA